MSIALAVINKFHEITVMQIQQYYGPFTMLLVDWSSETGLFRHLSNHVSRVHNLGNKKSARVIFFSKFSRFNSNLENAEKN